MEMGIEELMIREKAVISVARTKTHQYQTSLRHLGIHDSKHKSSILFIIEKLTIWLIFLIYWKSCIHLYFFSI